MMAMEEPETSLTLETLGGLVTCECACREGPCERVTWRGPVESIEGLKSGANATVISPGKIDCSLCGTCSSAWIVTMAERGELNIGDRFLGSEFHIRIEETAVIGDCSGIVPSISGRAWITGEHIYHLDPDDHFPERYALADTWHRVV